MKQFISLVILVFSVSAFAADVTKEQALELGQQSILDQKRDVEWLIVRHVKSLISDQLESGSKFKSYKVSLEDVDISESLPWDSDAYELHGSVLLNIASDEPNKIYVCRMDYLGDFVIEKDGSATLTGLEVTDEGDSMICSYQEKEIVSVNGLEVLLGEVRIVIEE